MKKREQGNLFLRLDALVPLDHSYRKLDQLLPFAEPSVTYQGLYSPKDRKEGGFEFAIRALIIQFMEDLSDREMERYLQENLACKWFCDMNLGEEAPDHSYFGDFRKRPGTGRLMNIFSQVRNSLQGMGLIREVFTFVDASQLISKLTTWGDRDRAIKQGPEQFNNETAGKVAADKQARFGCTRARTNTEEKNRDKDRWLSAIRAPYERVFAHRNKKVRYRGLVKVQFQVGIRALVFNLKRLMTLGVDRIT
ncbi:transposase [uncultured Nitrosomonas sp.]|uniref:transposase n=1 Tax=uncultured Nitrosomonas sp. TaxID=156424 RepID=UPI0025D7C601|nr:transposase [uncultured Nitrosomonas sp.]